MENDRKQNGNDRKQNGWRNDVENAVAEALGISVEALRDPEKLGGLTDKNYQDRGQL